MRRILIYCVLLFALVGVAVAQVLPADKGLLPPHRVGGLASGVRTSVAEYDTMLTVRPTLYTHCDGMEKLVKCAYHIHPGEKWRSVYKYPMHECIGDSIRAQEVYMARLEMLYDVGIRRNPLPEWVVAIVCNFEKLTGILNSGDDGDSFGRLYISSVALTGWRLWFVEHKEKLRFCPEFRVIYSVDPMVNMGLR